MDLEGDLDAIVEHAPDPPPFDRICARTRQRRRRRRAASSVVAVVVAVTLAGSLLVLTGGNAPTVSTGPTASAPQSMMITSLYGTTIKVDTKGYPLAAPRLDAAVQGDSPPFPGPPSIIATRDAWPSIPDGAATYTAADGHTLTAVRVDTGGDELVGSWAGWSIGVTVDGMSDAERARLASLLRFREQDGFLVLDPVAPLSLEPSVGTEIALNGIDIDASTYPSGCPTPAQSSQRTPEGFPVERIGTTAIWCDTVQRMRIQVQPPAPVDAMIESLTITR